MVFRTCADERNTTDVNLFDDVGIRSTRSHCSFKGIKVDNHEINFGDFVVRHLLTIVCQIASAKNTAKHFGMKRLHASTEDGRIRRQIFHLLAGKSERHDKIVRATSGKKFNTLVVKGFEKCIEPIFVEHRHESSFDFARSSHRVVRGKIIRVRKITTMFLIIPINLCDTA